MRDRNRGPETAPGVPTVESAAETPALAPLLVEPRRRLLLRTVNREGPIRIGDLADELAAVGVSTDGASPQRCREVYLELHHVDIPLLSGAGLVTYDDVKGTVSLSVPNATLGELLADVDERLSTAE